MEHIAAFVNDQEHAQSMLLPLLASHAGPTQWTIVVCTPRLTHRIGRFATRRSRDLWRDQWAGRLRESLEPVLRQAAGAAAFEWRTAHMPLPGITQQLRLSQGAGLRVLDARCTRLGAPNAPIVPEQVDAANGQRLAAPVAVTSALSLMLALAD